MACSGFKTPPEIRFWAFRLPNTNKPEAEALEQSVGAFAQTKLIQAYQRAFDELGRKDVRISVGTWRWRALQAMNEFYPIEASVYILDSEVIRSDRHLHNEKMITKIK